MESCPSSGRRYVTWMLCIPPASATIPSWKPMISERRKDEAAHDVASRKSVESNTLCFIFAIKIPRLRSHEMKERPILLPTRRLLPLFSLEDADLLGRHAAHVVRYKTLEQAAGSKARRCSISRLCVRRHYILFECAFRSSSQDAGDDGKSAIMSSSEESAARLCCAVRIPFEASPGIEQLRRYVVAQRSVYRSESSMYIRSVSLIRGQVILLAASVDSLSLGTRLWRLRRDKVLISSQDDCRKFPRRGLRACS